MMVSKTDNRFKTGFPKPITGLPKKSDLPKQQILRSLTFISGFDVVSLWSCQLFFNFNDKEGIAV